MQDASAVAEVLPRATATADAPIVRDATGLLLDAIRASYGSKVTRTTALRVPAFARAYKLYTGTISSFPLVDYGPAGERMDRPFLANPSQITTYTSLMARTVGDLIAHDTAYWRVTSRTWDGFPATAELMPYEQVNTAPVDGFESQSVYELGTTTWNGVPVPDRDVIRFDGDGTGGWLVTGVDAITTAASLEAAVLRSSEVPSPQTILRNTGADLPPDQVDALLDEWESARANRSTAYLNSTLEVVHDDGLDAALGVAVGAVAAGQKDDAAGEIDHVLPVGGVAGAVAAEDVADDRGVGEERVEFLHLPGVAGLQGRT